MLVAERLNLDTRQDVGYLTQETGPLQLRRVIVEMGDGRLPIVVATPRWATGWRAPLGLPAANQRWTADWAGLGIPEISNASCLFAMLITSAATTGTLRATGKISHG